MKKSNKWLMLALSGLLLGACGGPEEPKDKPADDQKQEQKHDESSTDQDKHDGQSDASTENNCPEGFTGANCDQCQDGYYGLKCKPCTCVHGECNDTTQGDGFCREETCERGFTGKNCNQCTENFTGENCDQCANELHSGENCDECADKRFTGEYCDECKPAANHIIDSECNSYKTVVINGVTWLANNIAYQGYGVECLPPDGDENNIAKYGCLYTWEDAQKVCPTGWRLPTKAEFDALMTGGSDSSIYRDPSWEGGSNTTKFSALPAGERMINDNERPAGYDRFGESAYFWASNVQENNQMPYYGFPYAMSMSASYATISTSNKNYGYSVRCVKK